MCAEKKRKTRREKEIEELDAELERAAASAARTIEEVVAERSERQGISFPLLQKTNPVEIPPETEGIQKINLKKNGYKSVISSKKKVVKGEMLENRGYFPDGTRFAVNEPALRAALKEFRKAGATHATISLADALHRHGERVQSLDFNVLMEQFARDLGMSKSTAWAAWKKIAQSDLLESHKAVRHAGTNIVLRIAFFEAIAANP